MDKERKSSLLDASRIEAPTPKHTYHTSPRNERVKKQREETTTGRVRRSVLNRANALVDIGVFSSFDDLVDRLLSDFEERELTADEKRMQALFVDTYEVKRRRRR